MFPMSLVLQKEVADLPGVPVGSRISVTPLEHPEIVTSQAFAMAPGRLYGWLLKQLLDGAVDVIPGPVSASEVVRRLRAVNASTDPAPAPPADSDPALVRLK